MEALKLKFNLKSQSSVLFISSIGGVGLGLLASILNTRFVSPEEYGNYRYVFNIISFFSSILLFGYFVSGSRLLALAKDSLSKRKINGAMVSILAIAVVVTIIGMIGFYFIQQLLPDKSPATLFLISIPVCGAPLLLNFINTTFQGENRINELSLARLLPYFIYLPIGLIVYNLYGSSAAMIMLIQNGCLMLVCLTLIARLRPAFKGLKETFKLLNKENKEYGFQVYIGSVLAVSFGYVSGMTLGIFESNNVNVGFYTLALTVATPMMMLPSIVGTTNFKNFATQNRIDPSIIKKTIILAGLSLFLFILMIIPLVKWIYTDRYAPVGYYACFLAVAMTLYGFGDLYNRFLGAHGKGKEIRNAAVFNGLVNLTGSIVLVYFFGIYGAIATRILASGIYFIFMVFYYNRFVNNN